VRDREPEIVPDALVDVPDAKTCSG